MQIRRPHVQIVPQAGILILSVVICAANVPWATTQTLLERLHAVHVILVRLQIRLALSCVVLALITRHRDRQAPTSLSARAIAVMLVRMAIYALPAQQEHISRSLDRLPA